jgi:hypothetical protein
MCALPPKADIVGDSLDIRFVPIRDQVHRSKRVSLFNQIVGAIEQLRRDGQTERFCGL